MLRRVHEAIMNRVFVSRVLSMHEPPKLLFRVPAPIIALTLNAATALCRKHTVHIILAQSQLRCADVDDDEDNVVGIATFVKAWPATDSRGAANW
jgi:hypothetical protein